MSMDYPFFGETEIENAAIDAAEIVVLPLCHEAGSSYGTGSGEGALHLLNASAQLERMDEETLTDWGLMKIHTARPLFPSDDPETAVAEMRAVAGSIMAQKRFLLSIGGDHAISIGPIMAAADMFSDLGVLQIDAHLDLRDEWNGSRYNHACVMRRVIEDAGLPVVQVGIRSFSPEEAVYVKSRHLTPFYAHEIVPWDDMWMEQVVSALPKMVYMTIDLDGLDPSVIPGTGTPEPGGLSYRQLVDLIKAVGREKEVVAGDINELVKIEGTQVSEFTAAKIATKIFVYCHGKT